MKVVSGTFARARESLIKHMYIPICMCEHVDWREFRFIETSIVYASSIVASRTRGVYRGESSVHVLRKVLYSNIKEREREISIYWFQEVGMCYTDSGKFSRFCEVSMNCDFLGRYARCCSSESPYKILYT